jgi:hypothetical protein
MNRTIFVVKGISGSGKSSRVFQLLKFFEKQGKTLSDFYFTNVEGKERLVGVLVEEENLLFIGKLYKSGAVERWQGYDAVTGAFKGARYFSEFLENNVNSFSVIVEGAGITQTHRLRPKFLSESGFENIMMQYYNYPEKGKEQYYNRIIYRSGEKPKKDVMWDKNLGFINDAKFSEKEIKEVQGVKIFMSKDEFEEPPSDFGEKYFIFTKQMDNYNDFLDFVEEFDYINKNKFENFQ